MAEVGSNVPPFECFSTSGKIFRFPSDLSMPLAVLVVYRKNQCTPCKAQLEFLREKFEEFNAKRVQLLTISYPPLEESLDVVKELNLPFPILSDPEGKILTLLGAINGEQLQSGGKIHSGLVYPTILILNGVGKVLYKLVTKKTASRDEMGQIFRFIEEIQNTGTGKLSYL
ncbi:MAG: bacterioferritin comigratory protein [Promethearchaeota archaeon CR_4]|nr:MAG: bacterioferritin comigratory protein [Candidatus Lokiarchaeota archaeon CR_4]